MKPISRFGLLAALCLAVLAPLSGSTHAAPAQKGKAKAKAEAAAPAPKPEPTLEAEINIQPAELSPESSIEVVFPTPMIKKDRVGAVETESPLLVTPALTGSFQWVSTRSGQFKLSQAPKFSTTYGFALRPGLRDLGGKLLSTARLDSAASAQFRVIDQSPKWFDTDDARRLPKFVFEFNDSVNADAAAKSITFVSEKPVLTVAAKVRHATSKDFKNSDPEPTWAEAISKVKPSMAEGAARLSAIVVEPAEPLAVAEKWHLKISPSLTNASGHDTIAQGDDIALGDVKPFTMTGMAAHTPFDDDYYIDIDFNRTLEPDPDNVVEQSILDALAQKLSALVHVDPLPADLKTVVNGRTLRLSGKFDLRKPYRVVLEPSVASGDGLALGAPAENTVTFIPNPPYVAAPAFLRGQLSSGAGEFEVSAANVSQVRLRARRLTGPELLQATDKYQEYRNKYYEEEKKKAGYKPASIEEYPGTQVFDKTFTISKPLDKSEIIKINWKEVLSGAPAGPLFLEMEGAAAPGVDQKGVITQTLVQFTDLGLMQKSNGRETMVFVSSLKTGKPLPGVRLTMVDGGQKLLGYADTDANGVAIMKGADPEWVMAEKDGDCAVIQTQQARIGGVIPYDLPTAWEDVWKPVRRTFIFSDRPLYRPGDTAHFKAHTRNRVADDLLLDEAPVKGKILIRDPRYRTILSKDMTFTANGSWTEDIKLPEGPMGWYELLIQIPGETESHDNDSGYYSFRIDDYKPNSFEVKLDGAKLEVLGDRLKLPLSANYFMGKALSSAKVEWTASSLRRFDPPQGFDGYHFGDAPRWAHYGKDRDADGYYDDSDSDEEGEWWVNGDLSINDDGTAVLEMPMPPPDRASLPQQVRVTAEVTDINQQTISAATQFEVPGAAFILGLKGPQYFGTAEKDTNVDIVAVDSKGRPIAGNVRVDVKVERQEYHTLKIATAGGGSTTKDQVVLREENKQTLELKPASAGSAPSALLTFKPARGGLYFVTAEATDAAGKKILTRTPLYVLGGNEFPWAMEDGARINLQPEQKKLKPGEEAVIVVKTPIAGTALVSVERNRVHRYFVTQISPAQPVIRVPVQDAEAPNVFVSVVLVRGSEASPKQHKMPEYKVGYCQLEVESKLKELTVAITPAKPEVKPAEAFDIAAAVTDHAGKAVAGSEVTLYAVDEGVLSLMEHKTPDPSTYFHAPQPLAVENYTSFDDILPEEFAARERGNKGFVIGGGGDLSETPVTVRKNFVATPLWLASGVTDAEGRITASVTAPDNLTRYRLMAVAVSGADRFGKGESAFKINKPLMVEPVVPRFARLADETLLKAVVHNTTPNAGEVEVTLELDATADFIREERFFVPAALKLPESDNPKVQKQRVAIKANETTSVAFPVTFSQIGTARWKWSVKTVSWSPGAPALDDGTESVFEVTHPVPEMRAVKYARLGSAPVENLIAGMNPTVLEGQGTMKVSLSTSRLYEAKDALEYILQYPYGCVEQSTSATIPWLALGGYQPLFPELLSTDKTKEAVQNGVNRLLRMTTDEGGLSYWPGGSESSFWGSAYGGFMLLRARDAGASVPDEVIDKLTAYLSKKLRGLEEETDFYNITDASLALYTLARAKKPEAAYQNLLYGKRDRIPEAARLYTALAMCLTNTPEGQIKEMLGWKPPAPPAPPAAKKAESKAKSKTAKNSDKGKTKAKAVEPPKPAPPPAPVWAHWAGNGANRALRLIAYTHLGLKSDAEQLAQSILQARNSRGEWGNTFSNAWTLTALVAYERSLKKSSEPLAAKVLWDAQNAPLTVPAHPGSASVSFDLNDALAAAPMKIELPAGREAFTRVEARTHPQSREFRGENKGYGITRTYEKLLPDGSTGGINDLRVGDMVVVSLNIEIGGGDRYLAINDSLPSVLEAINPEFSTQSEREGDQVPEGVEPWFCDHREVRSDRALFFTDFAPDKGKFQLRYLARVIAEGDSIAPPASIEAMYQPDKYGLSPTQRLKTLPSAAGDVAGK